MFACWLITAVVLMCSTLLYRLGPKGTTAVERLMGMLLIMIAVQMFLDGMSAFMHPVAM